MALFGYLLVVLLACLTGILWYKNSRYIRLLEKVPSPKGVMFLGNLLMFMVKREDIPLAVISALEPLQSCPIVCMWFLHLPHIFILRSSAAEVLLSSITQIEKSRTYELLRPWLGLGLLTSTGEKWHSRRKMLTPSFHFRILENFMPIFNEQSEILLSKLKEREDKGRFDIYPYITLCTLDIICDTAMGKRIDAQLNKNSEYVTALNSMSSIAMERTVKVWLLIPWIFKLSSLGRIQEKSLKILHKFTNDVIQERKRERLEKQQYEQRTEKEPSVTDDNYIYGRKHRMAFLDTLLEASEKGNLLTDEEIREEVDTFMFEGHDTTAVGISWALYALGWAPTEQKKVHEELDNVFGDSDRSVEFEDLAKLKYLEAAIKETLRLVPPVPMYARRIVEDIDITGYTIPAGTQTVIFTPSIHGDPELYPEPKNFKPSRFFTEDWQKRHPYGYVPFSAGPRNCIGQKFAMMEEKVVLAHILRKYEVRAFTPFWDVKGAADLVFRPINGISLSLKKRKH